MLKTAQLLAAGALKIPVRGGATCRPREFTLVFHTREKHKFILFSIILENVRMFVIEVLPPAYSSSEYNTG